MNLVEVATWIQEGYHAFNETNLPFSERTNWIVGQVMQKTKGRANPIQIKELVELETTIPDKNGMQLC